MSTAISIMLILHCLLIPCRMVTTTASGTATTMEFHINRTEQLGAPQ
jgi:hypothetical protein